MVDSYAWIELFRGGEKGKKVAQLIIESDQVFTPDIVLAEVARKYVREGYDDSTVKKRLDFMHDVSAVVSIDREIAVTASKCYIEMVEKSKELKQPKPGLADAIVLAISRVKDAKVVTGDMHFRPFKETIWLG